MTMTERQLDQLQMDYVLNRGHTGLGEQLKSLQRCMLLAETVSRRRQKLCFMKAATSPKRKAQ